MRRTTSPATAKEPYALEDQAGFILRRAHQRHVAIFSQSMKGLNLTPTQFSALAMLAEKGPVSQNRLGRLTAMDPATILGVAQRLEQRKLVRRDPDPSNSQAVLLGLTELGEEMIEKALPKGMDATAKTLAPLSESQIRQLLRLLKAIAD